MELPALNLRAADVRYFPVPVTGKRKSAPMNGDSRSVSYSLVSRIQTVTPLGLLQVCVGLAAGTAAIVGLSLFVRDALDTHVECVGTSVHVNASSACQSPFPPSPPPPSPLSPRLPLAEMTLTTVRNDGNLEQVRRRTQQQDDITCNQLQMATPPALNYIATFESTSFCTNYSIDASTGHLQCENEFAGCDNRTFDAASVTDMEAYCSFAVPSDDVEYPYLYVRVNRHVQLRAMTEASTFETGMTCVTDAASGLSQAQNATLSNALGVFARTVAADAGDPQAELTSAYFYSSTEATQYLCRNRNCSEALRLPVACPRSALDPGVTFGGLPTDIVAIAATLPGDDVVSAMLQLPNGSLTSSVTSIRLVWDTTYGAVFEYYDGGCTVAPYAINLRVMVQ